MIRGLGILAGLALIFTAIGQAVARGWLIDGVFLLLVIPGMGVVLIAALGDSEYIDENHPDALGSLDRMERAHRQTTAGGLPDPPQGARPPDARPPAAPHT